ncbi:MAG TPA: IPT/TIG domain-containing protein [Phycisphaerales bacterium]|nr:IPT/TIG domain-containing protein [Phycisphaerales bacterium]
MGLGAAGGGTASANYVAYTTLGELSGGTYTATNSKADVGFLGAVDPDFPSGLLLFAVSPDYGPKVGGTSVTVTGFNFDKFGSGPSMVAFVGGVPASSVAVASNTTMTMTVPPGLIGPRSVAIANSIGAAFKADGFTYTPAIRTPGTVVRGGTLNITNYGALGDQYTTFVSTSTCTLAAPPYGTLLIGPFPFLQLIAPTAYPGPNGVAVNSFPVPNLPALANLTVHFQSVSLYASGPPPGLLTNASTTTIL